MGLKLSTEHEAFRREVRAWIEANLPATLREKVDHYEELDRDEMLAWQRILASQGWAAPHWPQEWGGTDWDATSRYLFEQECARAGAPALVGFGLNLCAAILTRHGTEWQKSRFLPPMYHADEFWCQGYSEPGAGSDLAALSTRAVRGMDAEGEHYVVTGQKIWTSYAHYADWMFALVRTEPITARRQDGISFLLIDMKSPGVTVRPLILLDGTHEVNEVFLDSVRVPVQNRVGEEGHGWTLAKELLGFERLNAGRVGFSQRELRKLKAMARAFDTGAGRTLMEDVRFRDRVTRLEASLMAVEVTTLRFLDAMRRTGQLPGPDVGILKVMGTRVQQDIAELMMDAAGSAALAVRDIENQRTLGEWRSRLAPRYGNFRKTTIYGGSTEVQRNIFAKSILGI